MKNTTTWKNLTAKMVVRSAAMVLVALALAGCETAQEAPSVLTEEAATAKQSGKAGMSADQAHQVGREMSLAFLKKYPLIENDATTLYLNNVGQYVAKHLDLGKKNIKCANKRDKVLPAKGFRVAAVDTDEKIATAMLGGTIFVSKGLLQSVKTEDELAGVLAREATHVVCQDGVSLRKKLSRRQGKMADRGALMALYRAGYVPADYIAHMEAAAGTPTPGYASSVERVNWLKKDYVKMVKKGVVNTQKSRVARFEEFKKTLNQ